MYKIAKLTEPQLAQLKNCEASLEKTLLLAYDKPAEPANLSEAQLTKIQEAEKGLNIRLVAYK